MTTALQTQRVPARLQQKLTLGFLIVGFFAIALPLQAADIVMPGIETSKLDPTLKGHVLIEELNCVACHAANDAVGKSSKTAPLLKDSGHRINPGYLTRFIADPHGTKPGTPMPDVLGHLPEAERGKAAEAIAHYIWSLRSKDFSLQAPDAVAAKTGQRLFNIRGCAHCHAPRDEQAVERAGGPSVPLGGLHEKYSVRSLTAFLQDPLKTRPAGRMPDMQLAGREAEQIAHFLLQQTRVPGALSYTLYRGQVWEGLASSEVRAEVAGQVSDLSLARLGPVRQHTAVKYTSWITIKEAGTYQFFLTMNGGSLRIGEHNIIAHDPSDGRGVKDLTGSVELTAGQHAFELVYFHTGRNASFSCEMAGPNQPRGEIPASWFSVSREPIPVVTIPKPDNELINRGKLLVTQFSCTNCHTDLRAPPTPQAPLTALRGKDGCLSDAHGPWPKFALNPEQRAAIAHALPSITTTTLTTQQQVDKTLVRLNCLSCHDRSGLGQVSPERKAAFTGTQVVLGDQGRVPPPLTGVGAKLTKKWLKELLLNGQRQRPYLDAHMPHYGADNVADLVELFPAVDHLEKATIPELPDIDAAKQAAREMVGMNGMNCIACHAFNKQTSGDIEAVDLIHTTERLTQNWFHLYLRQPHRFHPTVIMPSYWPNGQSTRPNILGGDSALQIEAIWAYLSDGTKARRPVGLSRQLDELQVGAVAEICRGRSQIGYRGIAVGYPERISLCFDTEEMALRQLWKGAFASVNLGSFQPRGGDLLNFAPGVPFHRLKSLEDNWPYKGKDDFEFPQNLGYRFLGYELDELRRPRFRYQYGDIIVTDMFTDLRDKDGNPYFKRELTFEVKEAAAPFYFRAATGERVKTNSPTSFALDKLTLRITSEHTGKAREGNPCAVLIPLTLPAGHSQLTVEYQW